MDTPHVTGSSSNIAGDDSLQCNNGDNDQGLGSSGDMRAADSTSTGTATMDHENGQQVESGVKSKGKAGRPKGSKSRIQRSRRATTVAIGRALKLVAAGTPISASAKSQNLTPGAVRKAWRRLKRIIPPQAEVSAFLDKKTEFYDGTMLTILKSLNSKEKLKEASIQNLAYAAKAVHGISRLDAGLSTSNLSVKTSKVSEFIKTVTPIES